MDLNMLYRYDLRSCSYRITKKTYDYMSVYDVIYSFTIWCDFSA